MITVKVYADEVIFRLDQIPRKLREALRGKFEVIFSEFRQQTFSKTPGRFLDPEFIKTGVEDIGQTVVGFIEAEDKSGTYPIYPVKANLLRFLAKDGNLVYTKYVAHPFLKGAPIIERTILESKPRIEEQLRDAVIEAL
jgi:hypothetical protein